MKDVIIFSKAVNSFSAGGLWKEDYGAWLEKMCWWENCVDNWEVGSGWNGLTFSGHSCFGSMRNSGDFSSRDCMFDRRDCCGALSRPHSCVRAIFVRHETQDTL